MTDETVLDGNREDAGEKGSQPQSSTPSGQPSADVAALQKEIDELKKLYNGIKKSEDKINSRVEQRVSALTSNIERITELAKSGKSQAEIEERLILDEMIRERKGSGFPGSAEGTEQPGQGVVDVQDIARQLSLDVNDRDIAAALASGNIVNVMKVATRSRYGWPVFKTVSRLAPVPPFRLTIAPMPIVSISRITCS